MPTQPGDAWLEGSPAAGGSERYPALRSHGGILDRRRRAALPCLLTAAGCGRLETIPFDPAQTPESWLAGQPFVELTIASRRLIVVQPSTTAIVYLLGLMTIAVGLRFLRLRDGQRSRLGFGVALLLWGAGALLAGTSYEGFGYAIKCAGRATCAWTSWWEVGYLLLTGWAIGAMTLGAAHACAAGRVRRALSNYAAANAATYTAAVLTGAFVPIRFLVSFELLVLFAAPGVVTLIGLNARRHRRSGSRIDRALLGAWLGLIATVAAYALYLGAGVTQRLWARGIWFSENDVLHVGLVLWMIHLAAVVLPLLRDLPASADARG